MLAFFRNEMGFGGNNGLTDFKDILGFACRPTARASAVRRLGASRWPWATSPAALIITSRARAVLSRSAMPRSRTRFIGYKVEHVKLAIFTFSAMLAGVAGALYVPQVGIINPGEFAPLPTPSRS
jgi:urea transport system permease protein